MVVLKEHRRSRHIWNKARVEELNVGGYRTKRTEEIPCSKREFSPPYLAGHHPGT
jgi:hypothetical protein